MADLLFVLVLTALFAATAGFVVLCERMVTSDDVAGISPAVSAHDSEKAAA